MFIGIEHGANPDINSLGWDPSAGLLARFAEYKRPVLPISAFFSSGRGLFLENEADQTAIIYSIRNLCWVSDTEIEVSAGHYVDAMNASGFTFRLILANGIWVIDEERFEWVS